VLATPSVSQAQFYGGRADSPYGATTSPYLNLLQNNNPLNPTPTYQSLVRPLIDQNTAINRQGASLNRLQQQVSSGTGSGAGGTRSTGSTGHASFFMNYSHFYGAHR
jgi:hypothetical protein